MAPKEYFQQFVIPNLDAFKSDRTSYFKLFNAIIASYHMLDCVAKHIGWDSKRDESFEKHIIAKCPQLVLVSDAANAYKHIEIRKNHLGRVRDIAQLVKTRTGPEAAFDDCTYWDDFTSWDDAGHTVIILDDNDHPHDLGCCLIRVTEFWKEYLDNDKI